MPWDGAKKGWPLMAVFLVALSTDESYIQQVPADDASQALEYWASWYCPRSTDYGPEIECVWRLIEDVEGAWKRGTVTVESSPVFFGSADEEEVN